MAQPAMVGAPGMPSPMEAAVAAAKELEAAMALATSSPEPEEPPAEDQKDMAALGEAESPPAEDEAPKEEMAAEAPAEPDFKPRPPREKKAPPKRSLVSKIAIAAGWIVLIAIAGVAGFAAAYSDDIMERQPWTKPAYAALGFPPLPPGAGLQISSFTTTRPPADGGQLLVIDGKITNTNSSARSVPMLRGSLRDSGDKEVQSWEFKAAAATLGPNETGNFRTEVRLQSPQATGIAITFAPAPPP